MVLVLEKEMAIVEILADQKQDGYEKPLFEEQTELTFPREIRVLEESEEQC